MTRPLVRLNFCLLMTPIRARLPAPAHSCAADSIADRTGAPTATSSDVNCVARLAVHPRFQTPRRPKRPPFEAHPPFQSP